MLGVQSRATTKGAIVLLVLQRAGSRRTGRDRWYHRPAVAPINAPQCQADVRRLLHGPASMAVGSSCTGVTAFFGNAFLAARATQTVVSEIVGRSRARYRLILWHCDTVILCHRDHCVDPLPSAPHTGLWESLHTACTMLCTCVAHQNFGATSAWSLTPGQGPLTMFWPLQGGPYQAPVLYEHLFCMGVTHDCNQH